MPQATEGLAPRPLHAQSPAPSPPPEARVVASTTGTTTLPTPQARPDVPPDQAPPGREKIERDMEMARLAAEIQLRSVEYAKRPKRKFVSASTREYAWAQYLRTWVDRVERVGNLNYPEEARRKRIHGSLRMLVVVDRNGTVQELRVLESSGYDVLDEAAMRIVRLCAPFAPFTGELAQHYDQVEIIRTWRFERGDRLSAQ